MSDTPKRYVIKDVADFLRVPADRRADCLVEFLDFLTFMDKVDVAVKTVKWAETVDVSLSKSHFIWIDDGTYGFDGIQLQVEQKGTNDTDMAK
jgi:hypothetical protein